jgi:hypothetical protein
VIETPLRDDLDVNGWDLGKALKLLLKGNAVAIEWLRSPIVYEGERDVRDDMLSFARRFATRERIGRHYLHLGRRQRQTYFAEGKDVELKKIFYALRPAAALRWLRLHPGETIAPMHFPTLMQECDPPREVAGTAAELIERKAATRELGKAPLPRHIADFMDSEFGEAELVFAEKLFPISAEGRTDAERLFRKWVLRFPEGH